MSESIDERKRTVIRRFGPKRTNGAAEGGNIADDGRRLVLPESGDPDSYFTEFPLKEDFEDKQLEYIIAADEWDLARKVGEELVALKRPDLKGVRLGYLWKQKGGLRAGKAILGKAIKINPLLKTFSDRRGFVVLSADHVQGFKLTRWQVEALIYHELLHFVCVEGVLDTIGHDVEAFTAEVKEYGLWTPDLRAAHEGFTQPNLPGVIKNGK